MAAEDKVDSLIDTSAISKEVRVTIKLMGQLADLVKSFPSINLGNSSANLKELTAISKQFEAVTATTRKTTKELTDAEKDLHTAREQRKKDIDDLRKKNLELQVQAKEQQALDRQAKKDAAERSAAEKQAAADAVAAGRERILALKQEQEQIEKVAQAEAQRQQVEDQALAGTFNPGGNGPAKAAPKSVALDFSVDQQNIAAVKAYDTEIRKLSADIKTAEAAMKAGTISNSQYKKTFVENTEKIALAKNAQAALNKEINLSVAVQNTERNTRARAQALILQYTNAASRLNVATADGARLNDNYNKAIAKTNAFLKANGDEVTNQAKNVGNYGSAVSNAAKKAFSGLRTIANVIPGLGIGGIVLLALEPLEALGKAFVDLFVDVDHGKVKFEALQATLKAGNNEFKTAVEEVANLRTAFRQAEEGVISKEEALKLYNDTIGKTTGQVNSLDEAEKALAKNAQAYVAFTLLKAQATFALGKASEALFNIQSVQAERDLLLQRNKGKEIGGIVINDLIKKNADKALDEARENANTYIDIYTNTLKAAEKIGKEFKFDFNAVIAPKPKKEAAATKARDIKDNTALEILKAQQESDKLELQRQIDADKKILDNENKTYTERINALRRFTFNSGELIELDRKYAKAVEEEKLADTIKALEKEKKEKGANVKGLNAQIEKERIASQARLDLIDDQAFDKLQKLTQLQIDEQRKLKDGREAVQLEEVRQIAEFEQLQLAIVKKFKDAQRKLAEDEQKKREDLIKKGGEKEKELKKQLYKELIDAFSQFLTDGITRQEQDLEEKSRLLDEETARRINQINQLGLSEVERTKRIAEVEKNAQFQKEQIEKRQRALAYERAKFEKAANIAQIIASTAAAIVETLKTYKGLPIGFAIAATIGAIGAIQLAKAISTPLPKLKAGRKATGRTEWAILNDGPDQEFKVDKHGNIDAIQGKDTVTLVDAMDTVYPNLAALTRAMGNNKALSNGRPKALKEYDENTAILQNIAYHIKQQGKRPPFAIYNAPGIETSDWYQQHFKR